MQIVLAGASGLIGSALKDSLSADGHRLKTLVRHTTSEPDVDSWDPARGLLAPDFTRHADAVVSLSGAGAGPHRWTEDYKRMILASRVDTLGTVSRTLAGPASSEGAAVPLPAPAVAY